MRRFLKDYRLHEHTEALFLLTLGIIIQVLDGSPFDMWDRWGLAWETEFPREFFSAFIQQIIKTVLSIIILVRCLTTVLYVLSGLITIYCILRETSPKLMLPWLFISGLKSVILTFLETLTGVYVCSAFGKVRKPCIEFVVSKAIELFFAIYLWACIRSIHKDFEQFEEHYREEELLTKMVIHRVNLRRRRARSMIDESTLYRTSNLNYFGLKDVPNIIFDMLKTEDELSQDSLLSPGMMLASVSNMGSYDYLKTSLSLGELGIIDLNSFQVAGLDDHRHLSPSARAMKFLKLTREDIRQARERTRSNTFADNYKVPKDSARSFVEVNPPTVFNRLPRQKEVFAAKLPDLEKVKEHLSKKKKSQKFQENILSDSRDFDTFSQVETRGSAEQFIGLEDGEGDEEEEDGSIVENGETDGETTPNLWFMTNIKDQVNRIGLVETHNSKRSDNYERLYRQDYMSVIGAEVFDRASKLVRLTPLGDVISRRGKYENERGLVYPSTSGDANPEQTEPPEEPIDKPKPVKNKKLAFENHNDGPTAMPLSVIVTNFPIKLDSRIPKCEAVYYRETLASSAEILVLPDRAIEPHLEICDEGASNSEAEVKISESSTTEILSISEEATTSEDNKIRRSFAPPGDLPNSRKVNLFMLKCSRGTTPDFRYDPPNCPHDPRFRNSRGPTANRDLAVFRGDEQELPVIRPPRIMDDNFSAYDRSYVYPRLSEQMIFIRNMMRRPIRDVLRSYFNLREAENDNCSLKRICSSGSVRFENGLTMGPISGLDAAENTSQKGLEAASPRYESSVNFSSLESKTFADCETQVSFGEGGLSSTETVTLGSPRTKKLKTTENDLLPPLYLFGNKDLGWSSSPLQVSLDTTREKLKSNRYVDTKECGINRRGMMSSNSFPEGSKGNSALANLATSKDASYRMLLPPSQKNAFGKDSFSSAQDRISLEIIPVSDDIPSICSAESDESFSLFYSKTADLASPLLDTRRFIYPDHIHYSYKNVKKKGFDVELNGGLPLLVRDSLTLNPSINVKRMDTPPDPQTGITRRPMDLTFANLDMFPREAKQAAPGLSQDAEKGELDHFQIPELLTDPMYEFKTLSKSMKKEQKWLRKFSREERTRDPGIFGRELVDASSSNLHSNKGRAGMLSNPAVILQSNKLKKKLQRSRLKNVAGNL